MKKVIGLGNALVDAIYKVENDDILHNFLLPKGSMQLVDYEFSERLRNSLKNYECRLFSGGSAANTIHGLANLGVETAFIGKTGKDEFGDFFKNDLIKKNIEPKIFYSATKTGIATALITPDSDRTFATYLGAAVELKGSDITSDLFRGYDILHVEGYLVQNHELIETALEVASKQGLKISLDLASYNIVEQNLGFFRHIVIDYADIVFANEDEAKAFSGKDPEHAIDEICDICEIGVVKIGKNGVLIKENNKVIQVPAYDAKPIDTTGAGDAFAAGFLYGYAKGYNLEKCAKIGNLLAGHIIQIYGARINDDQWVKIKEELKEIEKQ